MQAGTVQVAATSGGIQNNVIPAEGEAIIFVPSATVDAVERAVALLADDLRREFRDADPGLRIETKRLSSYDGKAFSERASAKFIRIIALLPNGIQSQNLAVPGNWETANNVGRMMTTGGGVQIISTITSAVTSRKHAVLERMMAPAKLAGDGVTAEQIGSDAPEFRWNPNSHMLEVVKQCYERVMG